MATELKIDVKDNRLYPHPKVLEAYTDEKRGNNFPRQRRSQDDVYEKFYEACKKNPFHVTAKTVIRTRAVVQGKLNEVILAYCSVVGNSRMGDTIGQDLEYFYWQGVYDEPVFERKLNQVTDRLDVIGVKDHIRKYDLPFSKENMDKIMKETDDSTVFMVKETPETQGMLIHDTEGFQEANFTQLIEMGKHKRSLEEVKEIASAVSKFKKTQQEEVKKQVDIAEQIGEPKAVVQEIKQAGEVKEVHISESLDMEDTKGKITTETVKKKSSKK